MEHSEIWEANLAAFSPGETPGSGKDGPWVGVNHFVDLSWLALPTQNRNLIKDSQHRHIYLFALAEKNKGP